MRGMKGLAVVVAVVCMAGCDQRSSAAVAPVASAGSPVPATSLPGSVAPGVSSSAGTVPGPWVYRPTTPIPGIKAASLAERWSKHWGVTLKVQQTVSVHVQRTIVDYPAGHGTLELVVGQRGKGESPGASDVNCGLRDDSLGTRQITMTRALAGHLVADCWQSMIPAGDAKLVTDWLLVGKKVNSEGGYAETKRFDRFVLTETLAPQTVALFMTAR
jgi:hypothetical protein